MNRQEALGRSGRPLASADEVLGAGFGIGVLTLAVLHVLAAVLDLVLPNPGSHVAQAASAASAAAVLAAVAGWHQVWGLPPAVVPHAAGLVVTVAGVSSGVHLVLTADPLRAMYSMLILVGAGAVLPTLGWLLVLDAVSLTALVWAGLPHADQYAWQHAATALLFAVAVAHLLQRMRSRGQRRLDQLTTALAAQASRDDLTGLLNRRGLHSAGAQLLRPPDGLSDADQHSTAGAMYLDVDGFKRINDELGHAAGDAVLVEIADRLRQLVGAQDLVARIGGDEFAVVLPAVTAEQLAQLGHRARIRMTGTAGVLQLPWTVSVGTALAPSSGVVGDQHLTRLLQAADLAMYQDKESRRATALQHR